MCYTVETVQLHQSGWALLVSKTKIYLWRYIGKVNSYKLIELFISIVTSLRRPYCCAGVLM